MAKDLYIIIDICREFSMGISYVERAFAQPVSSSLLRYLSRKTKSKRPKSEDATPVTLRPCESMLLGFLIRQAQPRQKAQDGLSLRVGSILGLI